MEHAKQRSTYRVQTLPLQLALCTQLIGLLYHRYSLQLETKHTRTRPHGAVHWNDDWLLRQLNNILLLGVLHCTGHVQRRSLGQYRSSGTVLMRSTFPRSD